jgi:HSP20 family protein
MITHNDLGQQDQTRTVTESHSQGRSVTESRTDRPLGQTRRRRTIVPPVDIFETSDRVVILADCPGVEQKGLDVSVDRGVLTLRGTPTKGPPQGFDGVYVEFEPADFERSFILSDIVDTERTTATIVNGVVRIELPKHEHAKPRKIPVQSGSDRA